MAEVLELVAVVEEEDVVEELVEEVDMVDEEVNEVDVILGSVV